MRYRKIDPRFWSDERVRKLNTVEKAVALYLFTAQSNRIGLFYLSTAKATQELGMETLPKRSPNVTQTFEEGFAKVCRTLNIGWDEEAQVLYLPTWWKYNHPENGNVLKGALKDLHEVPKTRLFAEFSSNMRYLATNVQQTFRDGLANVCQTLPERMPNQEQEQYQEQEQEQDHEQDMEGCDADASPPPAKHHRKAVKTSWPETLTLTDSMRTVAEEVAIEIGIQLNCDLEFAAWRDDCLSNGRQYTDWVHAWRNRIRGILKFGGATQQTALVRNGNPTRDALSRVMAKFEREESGKGS